MKKNLIIIDYQLGNIFSVQQACSVFGFKAIMSSKPEDLSKADAILLPGVGAFGDAMKNIKDLGLDQALTEFHNSGKPIMGICLGMQLMFSNSSEFGIHDGLNLVKGKISRFPIMDKHNNRVKVPQTRWNKLIKPGLSDTNWNETPLQTINEEDYFYFVHSYFAMPENPENILSLTEYGGIKYCSTVKVDNIFATQYHPEKSGKKGLEIYKHWLNNI